MPNRQLILNECIQQLLDYSRWRIKIWRKYKARARFVAEIMQQYLSEGNLEGAENVVRDQIRLLTLYDNPLFAYKKKELYKHHEETPFAQKDSAFEREDNYYKILHKALQDLATEGSEPSTLPGVNITHRIWLGGNLSQENITKIKCANIAIAKKWLNKKTKKNVTLKHYIWTNRQDLIDGLHDIPNTEFKDVMLLFESRSPIIPLFQSFVEHKEYAFASDLARFEACYKYGGLFLGISWSAATGTEKKEFFAPDMNSVRVFVIRTEKDMFLPQPFSGNHHKQLLYTIEFHNRCFHEELITHDIIDSELLYFGRPFHPLCRLILEGSSKNGVLTFLFRDVV